MSEKELLADLISVFPMEGANVPYVELKFRFAGKYSPEVLDSTLKNLVDQGVLTTFEFGGLNYKALKDIPVGGAKAAPASNGGQLDDLGKIIVEMAKHINDASLKALVEQYQSKYM